MNTDQVIDTVWVRLGQEKYLVWEVKIALLVAAVVSYFTMPVVITFLIAVAWVLMMATLRQTESAEEKPAQNT